MKNHRVRRRVDRVAHALVVCFVRIAASRRHHARVWMNPSGVRLIRGSRRAVSRHIVCIIIAALSPEKKNQRMKTNTPTKVEG